MTSTVDRHGSQQYGSTERDEERHELQSPLLGAEAPADRLSVPFGRCRFRSRIPIEGNVVDIDIVGVIIVASSDKVVGAAGPGDDAPTFQQIQARDRRVDADGGGPCRESHCR
jgi:hypothetical protein